MDPDSTVCIIVVVLLSLLSAVFRALKNGFLNLRDWKVEEWENERDRSRLMPICEKNEVYSTRSGAIASVFEAVSIVLSAIVFFPVLSESVGKIWAGVILVAVWMFLHLGLMRGISMAMSLKNTEKFILNTLWIYTVFNVLFAPVTYLMLFISKVVSRVLGLKPDDVEQNVTEEDIRMMVDEGTIEEGQKEMINNVFEFDDITADVIMTHRIDIVALEREEVCIKSALEIAIEHGYSRIPVYEDDIDKIVGIVYVKDLLKYIKDGEAGEVDILSVMRQPLYVPESIRCRDLFHEMKVKKMQLAVVLDEYGGTSGIITMEDILESIVGNIQDEYDNEEEEISACDDGSFVFDGTVLLDDVKKVLDFEIDEDVDYDTLGGFIISLLDRIPSEGETPSVTYKNVTFEVLLVEERRIAKVKATVNEPIQETEE